MFEALRLWQDRQFKFGEAFRYQYVISREQEDVPSFNTWTGHDWNAYTGKDLPVTSLRDAKGHKIGCLLGIAVGPDGLIGGDEAKLPLDAATPDFWAAFERFLTEVAGRYGFLLQVDDAARFYTDPVGMIGCVYDAEGQRVAASPLMALKRPVLPNPNYDFDVIKQHGGKISLFHTVDAHVHRLNPNCYLDLDRFDEVRFWPTDENFSVAKENILATYDEIASRASFNLGEIARNFDVALPVSGGQDSRLLLAFAHPHKAHINQVYTHINNYATRRDATIGRALCESLGVPHEVHDCRDFGLARWEAKQSKRFYEMTLGMRTALPKEYSNGVITGVKDGSVILRGHQTDLLRAVYVFRPKEYWHEPDWQIARLLIVPSEMFNADIAARFRPYFQAWQAGLPDNARQKAADFMFLETYYNATLGATFPALWRNFYVSPFNSRRLITLALKFDEPTRRASCPVYDIIERHCPVLSQVPFDFELHADIGLIDDKTHCKEVTQDRMEATRQRLIALDAAAPPNPLKKPLE